MDATALKAIAEYGLAIVALVVVTGFAGWLVRTGYEDLKKQRDSAIAGWQGQIAATDKLADSVATLTDAVATLTAIVRDRQRA